MQTASIDRARTALVVIDLQKGVVSLPTVPHPADLVVKNAVSLADMFRSRAMYVVLVRVAFAADGKDFLEPVVDAPRRMPPRAADWTEIVPELGPKRGDLVVTKHQWGAFYGTELDLQLRRRGISTIVLCGISTNIGVESTARFAYEYGYHQIFAEDAMAALSVEEHTHSITKIFPRLGLVRKTSDILAAI